MTRALVLCDGASPRDASLSARGYDKVVKISQYPPKANLNYKLTNVTHKIASDLDAPARDLLDLAVFVWAADSDVNRGSHTDIMATKWKRDLSFVVPCRNPDLWNSEPVKELLTRMLSFLSGDAYSFYFVSEKGRPEQAFLEDASADLPSFGGADCAALFSGGLDSLAGVVQEARQGRKPLLISHRSRPTLSSLQTDLVKHLQERLPTWHFPHISLWVNRHGKRRAEYTQRTRSFLYLSLAAAVAHQCGLDELRFFENGIVSFNLPLLGQNVGTQLTRTTHPRFIAEFGELLGLILGRKIALANPFTFTTKGEVARTLEDNGVGELIGASVSCAHSWMTSRLQPHCGTCSQCVDRRFAIASQGLESRDAAHGYKKDTFVDALDEGSDKACALGYVQAAMRIAGMSDVEFFAEYPELFDAFPYVARSNVEAARQILDLFKRHSNEVLAVVRQLGRHWGSVVSGKLPESCLVRMVGEGLHLPDRQASSRSVPVPHAGDGTAGTDTPTAARVPGPPERDAALAEPPAMTMTVITQELKAIASTACIVLLTGEPGTGKGHYAQAIHEFSKRKGAFKHVLCPAIPKELFESELFGHVKGAFSGATGDKKGLVEAAAGGTLFLDEVAELPPSVQAKLLQLLQEGGTFRRVGDTEDRRATCRVILATNRDLPELIRHGEFREDLHARIRTYSYELPPLRERKEEIPELVQSLSKELVPTRKRRVSKKGCQDLQDVPYDWPGNIRTLRAALDRAFTFAKKRNVTAADILQEAKRIAPSDEQKRTL